MSFTEKESLLNSLKWCTGLHGVKHRELLRGLNFVYNTVGGTCHSQEHIYVITNIDMNVGGIGILSCLSVFPL